MTALALRPATAADIPAIAAIYDAEVRGGTATFEIDPPGPAEMERRFRAIVEAGFPYLVAEAGGQVLGYAYAGPYRPRPAYRFTVENSIYLASEARGRGVGTALLGRLIGACEAQGCRQMIAVIGDSANAASIALHRRCGFTLTGTFVSVGWKFGRWVDSVLMQRPLGRGDAAPPE